MLLCLQHHQVILEWLELAGTTGWMEKVFVGCSAFEGFPSGISSSGFHPFIGRIHLQRD